MAKKSVPKIACGICGEPSTGETCSACGRSLCESCLDDGRTCLACSEYFCPRCVEASFHLECPNCGLLHHDACRMALQCHQCGVVACEDCTGLGHLLLCESCDVAHLCDNCLRITVGDESHELDACRECDVIGPALDALDRWKKTRRFAKHIVAHASTLRGEDIHQLIRETEELSERLGVTETDDGYLALALACLVQAAGSSRWREEVEADLDYLDESAKTAVRKALGDRP